MVNKNESLEKNEGLDGSEEEPKTFVFIDVSNIRVACLTSCRMNLDFIKLYDYLHAKYPGVTDMRYYEGVGRDDEEKKEELALLASKGYTICALERKAFIEPAKYGAVRCQECSHLNKVLVSEEHVRLKSNVDVYLTSDMIETALHQIYPARFVLVACDGDYVEAIKATLRVAPPGSSVVVLATPRQKDARDNALSIRLKNLRKHYPAEQYMIDNIENVRDKVAKKLKQGQKNFIKRRHEGEE